MDRERVLRILREHQRQLHAAGVEHLRLFGSVARGDQTAASDIDLAITMDPTRRWTLFTVGGVQMDLTEMLGAEVNVALLEDLRSPIRERVLREGVDAF